MALQTHPTGGRPAYDLYERRLDLYRKAAPVFSAFGYRQVTMKAIAHACGLSVPAIYRYFPSKLEFALFPLGKAPTGYCAIQLNAAADAHVDPLRGLRAALETAAANGDIMILAVRLAIEAGRDAEDVFSGSQLDAIEGPMVDIMLRSVPALGPRARDFAHTLVSLTVTAGAAKAPLSREDQWRQSWLVVRAYLLDAGVDEARFNEVFAG